MNHAVWLRVVPNNPEPPMYCDLSLSTEGLVEDLLTAWEECDAAQKALSGRSEQHKATIARLKAERDPLRAERDNLKRQISTARICEREAANPTVAYNQHIRIVALNDRLNDVLRRLSIKKRAVRHAYERRNGERAALAKCKERLATAKSELILALQGTLRGLLPEDYREEFKVVVKRDRIHIYFGGEGLPDGKGHAHYITTHHGQLVWQRNIDEKRGRHL